MEVLRQAKDNSWVVVFNRDNIVCLNRSLLPIEVIIPTVCQNGLCGQMDIIDYGQFAQNGNRIVVIRSDRLSTRALHHVDFAKAGNWYTLDRGKQPFVLSLPDERKTYHFWIEGHITPNLLSEDELAELVPDIWGVLAPFADVVFIETFPVGQIFIEGVSGFLDLATAQKAIVEWVVSGDHSFGEPSRSLL